MSKQTVIDSNTPATSSVPQHVAIIMDGNGRWATSRGLNRSEGHIEGVNTVRRITEAASVAGVKFLTLYTFSTENWNRPKQEVDMLMSLIVSVIERETPHLLSNNVRLQVIGDKAMLPAEACRRLEKCVKDTSVSTGLTLVLAISYSARWEITAAMQQIAAKVQQGLLDASQINDNTVAGHLTTAGMPDPDLLIRTGGDQRVSNFLLWQIAYSEIYIIDKYWPDFSTEDFNRALADYSKRQRRFGLTGEQITERDTI